MRPAEQLSTWLYLPAAAVPCKTAPFASFSGRTEKGGPARPERIPIFSSLIKVMEKFYEIVLTQDTGFADATSFSLLDAKRTKQEKHAWGSIPHDPRARRFGSRQLSGTLKPVRRKGFKLTASRRFRQEAFSFPRCAGKFPHEPRRKILQALPWPSVRFLSRRKLSVLVICMEPFWHTGSCCASFSRLAFIIVTAAGRPRQHSALLTAWLVRGFFHRVSRGEKAERKRKGPRGLSAFRFFLPLLK